MKLTAGSLTRTIKYVHSYLYGRWTNTARVCQYSVTVSSDFMRPKCRAADDDKSSWEVLVVLQFSLNFLWLENYGKENIPENVWVIQPIYITHDMKEGADPKENNIWFNSSLVMSRALCDAGLFVDDEGLKADPRATEDYQTMIGNSDVNGHRWVR